MYSMGKPSLVLHGGAWDIPASLVAAHRKGLRNAIATGWQVLLQGGSALDAVEKAIVIMEDDETFDAGRGSFLNAAGEVELDASVMYGKTFRAGAVAAVQNIRNPISLARIILERSEHVLLIGMGASRFAREQGMKLCRSDDLIIAREVERWRSLQREAQTSTKAAFRKKRRPAGTVGGVAVDRDGNVAAGTSTGGTPNKYPGRVGDTPLIGCGTYADNNIGGASTSGWGEAMMEVVMAKTVVDLMDRNGRDPAKAVQEGLKILVRKTDGFGGVIALNKDGDVGIAYNTPRMARAFMSSDRAAPLVQV
jgi:beta-aspartyl-peptidase (threonine type)